MTETELTDLLQTAARATGQDVRPDPAALISRARRGRRRQRMTVLCAVALVVVFLGGTTIITQLDGKDGGIDVATKGLDALPEPVWSSPPAPGWTRLPDAPLSPRSYASVTWTGSEVVVLGGSKWLCPPSQPGGCTTSEDMSFHDGAAFNPATSTWRPVAPPPRRTPFDLHFAFGLGGSGGPLTVVNGDMFLLTGDRLLRYRPASDAWDALPALPVPDQSQAPADKRKSFTLTSFGSDLVAFGSNEFGEVTDWRLDLASGAWTQLPENPLPPVWLRRMVAYGDDLVVFGETRPPDAPSEMVAARLDVASGKWTTLPSAPGTRFAEAVLDGVAVTPSPSEGGGIFDPGSDTWQPLPRPLPPAAPDHWRGGMVGVLRATSSSFATNQALAGSVLDLATKRWLELPALDDRGGFAVTGLGRQLFLYGGQRWPAGSGGQLLGDAWVWTPPSLTEAATLAPPTLAPPSTAQAAPPTIAPAPPPATTPIPGAPVFVSAAGDATTGRVTLRFDRPVTGDAVDRSPGSKTFSPDKTHPMNMIVFGADAACSGLQGNGQDYVSGLGTDTVALEATSLAAGTTYVGIGQGVVKSVADGTFNGSVMLKDLPSAGMFGGMSCIPIKVAGAVPTTVPYTDPVGGPELLSATATSGAGGPPAAPGTGAGRITLKFDKPVVPGDGPNFDGTSPDLQPAAGDNYMRAMQLVVHKTDSSCSSPNGNAIEYLAGVGTDTLTVDASSLVVGTTYISISPGFAKGASDGVPMKAVRCLAIPVTG